MLREIIKSSLKKEIFAKYGNKCYICGYFLKPALRAHHIIPVNLGGKDDIDNFVLLCSNCHTLIHFYSSKRYRNNEIRHYLNPEFTEEAIEKLKGLVEKVQNIKREIENNKNLWITKRPYTLDEVINMVSHKNKFTDYQRKLLLEAFKIVLNNLPKSIVQKCSYRLLKNGKYISINLMNYLLFRTPAYGDFGEKPKYDCYIIFPNNISKVKFVRDVKSRIAFNFKYFTCVNLGLSYSEVLKFTDIEWNLFRDACEIAHNARKTRNWISNVDITTKSNVDITTGYPLTGLG